MPADQGAAFDFPPSGGGQARDSAYIGGESPSVVPAEGAGASVAPDPDDWEVVVMVRATEEDAVKLLHAVVKFIYDQGDLDATIGMRREVNP